MDVFHDYITKTWMALLCLKNRRDCLFGRLDKVVISKIIEYAVSVLPIDGLQLCHRTILECGHTYHRHCFQQWVQRKQNCPLCGELNVIPIGISEIITEHKCKIVNVYDTNTPFESRSARLEKISASRTWIMLYLKKTVQGQPIGNIRKESEKWPSLVGYMDEAIDTLLEREYIHKVGEYYVHDCHFRQ